MVKCMRKHVDEKEHVSKKSKARKKFKKVMHEFKEGDLHAESKMGPLVTKPKQAVAIAYSEARRVYKKKAKKKSK